MQMDTGKICESGSELLTEDDCTDALKYASELGISLLNRKDLQAGSWNHVPYQCSYQAGGDNSFHFNNKQTNNVHDFVNGMYKMICKTGKIH